MRWVNPYLSVRDAAEAAAFYQRAFGFKARFSMKDDSGRTGHTDRSRCNRGSESL